MPLHTGIRCLVDVSSSASTALGCEALQESWENNSRQQFRPRDRGRINDFQESLGSKVESQLVILGFRTGIWFGFYFPVFAILVCFLLWIREMASVLIAASQIESNSRQHPPYQLSLAVFACAREAHISGQSAPRSSSRPFVEKVPVFANHGSLSRSQHSALSSCGLAGMN